MNLKYDKENPLGKVLTAMKKKLYRLEEGKMLCGVCAGIAEYLDIDVTIVRVGVALLTLARGSGLILYLIAALIIPVKSNIIDAEQ